MKLFKSIEKFQSKPLDYKIDAVHGNFIEICNKIKDLGIESKKLKKLIGLTSNLLVCVLNMKDTDRQFCEESTNEMYTACVEMLGKVNYYKMLHPHTTEDKPIRTYSAPANIEDMKIINPDLNFEI